MENALKSYLQAAKEFPREFKIIECIKNKKLLPPNIIHQKIWKLIKKIL